MDDIRALLDYHYWARDRLLAAVEPLTDEQRTRDMGSSFRSIHDTLVHSVCGRMGVALAMERRVADRTQPGGRVSRPCHAACAMDGARTAGARARRRRRRRGLHRVYEYKSLAGAPGRSPLWQMVQHLVNHASYHRGQVTTMLRQIGAAAGQEPRPDCFLPRTGVTIRTMGGRGGDRARGRLRHALRIPHRDSTRAGGATSGVLWSRRHPGRRRAGPAGSGHRHLAGGLAQSRRRAGSVAHQD